MSKKYNFYRDKSAVIHFFCEDMKMLKDIRCEIGLEIKRMKKLQATNSIQYCTKEFHAEKKKLQEQYTCLQLFHNFMHGKKYSVNFPFYHSIDKFMEFILSCLKRRGERECWKQGFGWCPKEVSYTNLERWKYMDSKYFDPKELRKEFAHINSNPASKNNYWH